MGSSCTKQKPELKANITTALANIRSAATAAGMENVPIMMTGYAPLTAAQGATVGCTNASASQGAIDHLKKAIKEACEDETKCVFVDASGALGTPTGQFATIDQYHIAGDAIHLNNRGYCKLFGLDALRSCLGCT